MTISPPSKVENVPAFPSPVLASGVDSLDLAIDVIWQDESLFDYLQDMKALAKQEEQEIPVIIGDRGGECRLLLSIKPHGSGGYEWLLHGSDYSLNIGKWLKPISRPSILAKIHSEPLWALGPQQAVAILLSALQQSGAQIQVVKPSRVDLCVDYLMPEKLWSVGLLKNIVTRAASCAPHLRHKILTGISIGRGKVAARLYDKPLEISQKSKKFWMYEIWGVSAAPEGYRIIRVEGQFRREAIKQLGIDRIDDLFSHLENLWAYFTQRWLKFQNKPGKHPAARKNLPFWNIIQGGFFGVQGAAPLVRCRSIQTKKKQLAAQAYGIFNSFIAVEQEERDLPLGHETTLGRSLDSLGGYFHKSGKNDFELGIDILGKRAKYHKATAKMLETQQQRQALGFPCNLPLNLNTKD